MDNPSTERLDAERPSLERHLEFITALSADPEVARWHWPGELGGPRSPGQARELLEEKIKHWTDHGFGQWIWRERESGELVARVGLAWTTASGEPLVEVGWSVARARQGNGFATEAARAALEYGFRHAGLEEIVSYTWTENAASLRVMEKLGMRRVRQFEHAGLAQLLYAAQA